MLSIPIRARRGALAAILIASILHANAQQTAASGSLGGCNGSGRSTDLPGSIRECRAGSKSTSTTNSKVHSRDCQQ